MAFHDADRSSEFRSGGSLQGRFGRWLLILLLIVIVGCALWTWLTLAWAYADGERAGVLQKFVRRGWVCKTQEGEIALYYGGGHYMGAGTSPQLWDFSVRDKAVGAQLTKAVGHRVQLHYTEHPGIPTDCFADTRYFVDRVTITDNEPGAIPGSQTPAPGRTAAGARPAAPPRARTRRAARLRKIAAASWPPARQWSRRCATPAVRPRRSPAARSRSTRTRGRQ